MNRKTTEDIVSTYNRFDLWGNTFIQSNKIGFASYHFDSSTGQVYISYEHDDCCYWPALDDGSPVPSRVPFVNTSYNADTRTFRGHIAWRQMYQTTWNGSEEWQYEMKFDSEFICILSGTVHSINRGQSIELSEYGSSLVYINAALKHEVIEQLSSLSSSSVHNLRAVALETSRAIAQHLNEEGATIRTMTAVTSAINGASITLLGSSVN